MANANGWGDGASNNNIGWGQGADNAIGWGDIHANSWAGATDIVGAPSTDPDAQAFITAASITDPTQQSAINTLVTDLKGYGVWTKMKALYPFCGSTASQHKWNLKDPRDLDVAFRLVFNGGWTHSANGALPNGTNAYADTFLTPSTALSSQNSTHLSSYIRTASQGVLLGTDNSYRLWIAPNFNGSLKYFELNTINATSRTPISTSTGFWLGNRPNSIDAKLLNQGVLNDNYSSQAWGLDNFKVFLAARNVSNTGSNYSSAQIAFSSIGDGLTDTEVANFYTAVQAFQTTLGRSIGTQSVSDADAQAFVTNAGIVDQVEANAINNLVIGLKADGLWTKMKACYPMVGGSSSTMKYNLVNPLDTDAAFRLVFNGGWTFSSTGATPNGTNGWADTFVVLNTLTRDSNSTGIYIRTNVAEDKTDYGMFDTGANGSLQFGARSLANLIGLRNGSNQADSIANSDSRGFFQMTRRNSSEFIVSKNITKTTITRTATDSFGNANKIPLGCLEFGGKNYFSSKQFALFYIGNTSLNDTELDNMNTRVTTFQTALNRNV